MVTCPGAFKNWIGNEKVKNRYIRICFRYYESAYFGIRFRHLVLDEHVYVTAKEHYVRMLEEDRDATMLRLIEAFCEAGPQLVIQMHVIGRQLQTEGAEFSGKIHLPLIIIFFLLSLTFDEMKFVRFVDLYNF